MSDYVFVSDEEVLERMADFYDHILPPEQPVEEEKKPFRPDFDYSEIAINGLFLVLKLIDEPFLNFSSLIKASGLPRRKVEDAARWLLYNGFVKPHSFSVGGTGKKGNYLEVLPEALELLGGKAPLGRGGFQHKCFCYKVADFFAHQGLNVSFEAPLEGMRGAFDLLAGKNGFKWFGIEVTLSFKNLIDNVVDGLRSSVDELIIVCENKDSLERAKRMVLDNLGKANRLDFKTIGEFKIKEEQV